MAGNSKVRRFFWATLYVQDIGPMASDILSQCQSIESPQKKTHPGGAPFPQRKNPPFLSTQPLFVHYCVWDSLTLVRDRLHALHLLFVPAAGPVIRSSRPLVLGTGGQGRGRRSVTSRFVRLRRWRSLVLVRLQRNQKCRQRSI